MGCWGLLALVVWIPFVYGCGRAEPKSAETAPFITPQERQRMSVEERDDPYTLKHLQPAPAPRSNR